MRLALIGVGRIGAAHARTIRGHSEVTELLVADADVGRAKQIAEGLDATHVATLEEIFDRPVDAVVIATPTSTHADLVLRSIDAGVPAFCEKPVAEDLERTADVVARVARSGVPVQVGFQRRFDAGYLAGRRAVLDGRVGRLHRLHLITADPAPPHPSYIPTSGGIFRDCHIHDFDIARFLTGGDVVEVYATGANRGAEFFAEADDVDTSAAILTFTDGTLATLQGSRYNGAGYDVRAELAGTAGTYVVGLDDNAPLRSAESDVAWPSGDPWPDFWHRFQPAYIAEIEAFLGVVAGRVDNPCTVSDALEALYIAEAAERSRRERRPVRLDEIRLPAVAEVTR
ncbi:MAG TPA: Gfo/Idh/MocA family oxidoreductase [Actinoplanes sp.]|jgi:myo-inositol 2-dehydrogenase/D-chiro-inositol 1-dehydrogenase